MTTIPGGRAALWARLYPYALAILAVGLTTLVLLGGGALVNIRIEAYPLLTIFVIGLVAWRYGRGPALAATAVFAILMDYVFLPPSSHFGTTSISDFIGLVVSVAAAIVVLQVIHLTVSSTAALKKRKELLEEVSPRIGQSLDARRILATVADETLRVIDYQHFRLYRWDERAERLILVKSVARTKPYTGIEWETLRPGLGEGISGLAAQRRRSVLVADASRDPRVLYPPGASRPAESMLSVPLITGDRLIGVMTLSHLGPNSLVDDDQRLMEAIAAQTALALTNAEQYSEAEQTIQALTALEALVPGTAREEESVVSQRIVRAFTELSAADMISLRILDPADRRYHIAGAGGSIGPDPSENFKAVHQPLDPREVAWLADSRLPAQAVDTQTDPKLPEWARETARRAGVQTSVFLPMRGGRELLGFVGLHWKRPHWLTPEQLGRLQLIAAQAAISLETRRALEDERTRASQLAELERSRREFMQIASHELRTPLTVIRGYASLLEDGSLGPLPERARAALATLIEKSGEMRAMVERMLFLARLEEGRPAYNMRPVDVGPIVSEAVSRVQPQLTLRHGRIHLDLDKEPMVIQGDAERLATSLDNLLQNAAKFSQGPPDVEVSARRADGQVEIVVADHGIGVPAGSINRLFEKFYRVDDPRLRNVGGTGIGLYMVRQVVEGHHGTISVDSQENQGTGFTIRFPIAPEGPVKAATDPRVAPARTPPPASSPRAARKDG